MQCQPLLLTFPLEIQYEIASHLQAKDIFAYRFSCKALREGIHRTAMTCVLIKRGFVYDVIQQYLAGFVTSEVFSPFVDVVSSAPQTEKERLLKGFQIYFQQLFSKIENEKDWDAVIPFIHLWVMSRNVKGPKTSPRDLVISLAVNWIFHKSRYRSRHLHQVIKVLGQSSQSGNLSEYISSLLLRLCQYHKRFRLSDKTKERITELITDNERQYLPLYFSYLEHGKYTEYLTLAASHNLFFHQILIPSVIEKDKLRELASKIGNELLTKTISAKTLANRCYHMQKERSFKYAFSLFDRKDKLILEALWENNLAECSEVLTEFPWPCEYWKTWDPLSLALDFQLWFEAFALLSYLKKPSRKTLGAEKILQKVLGIDDAFEGDEKEKFISMLFSFGQSNESLERILRICFSYRNPFSFEIVDSAESFFTTPQQYRQSLIDVWLDSGESHMKYYWRFVWKCLKDVDDHKERETLIFKAIKKGLAIPLFSQYRTKLINKLYLMLSSSKRYDVMLLPDAHRYISQDAFFFLTLSINTEELPPKEAGCKPN